jgi:hypothetical protein
MNGKIARIVAAIAAASMLALASGGVAAAAAPLSTRDAAGQEAGGQVLQLRDRLANAAYAGDVEGTKAALEQLGPVLGDISTGHRYSTERVDEQLVRDSQDRTATTADVLAGRSTVDVSQIPPVPGLPPLPAPLGAVNNLLQGLLVTLSGLLGGLLGTVPAIPVPVPAIPVAVPAVPVPAS